MEHPGQEFLKMHQSGMSYSRIAVLADTTRSAVAGYIYRQKNPEYLAKGRAWQRKATARNVQRRRGSRMALVKLARPQTERDHAILALYAKGAPLSAIGKQVGVSGQAIIDRMRIICGRDNYARLHAHAF